VNVFSATKLPSVSLKLPLNWLLQEVKVQDMHSIESYQSNILCVCRCISEGTETVELMPLRTLAYSS